MTVQVEAREETHEELARRNVEAVNREAGPNPIRIGVLTPLTPPGDPTAGELICRGARIGAGAVLCIASHCRRTVRRWTRNVRAKASMEENSRC